MFRLIATVVLACLPVALSAPREAAAAPHPGPPVYVEVDIGEAAVTFKFTGEQVTLNRWFHKAEPEVFYEAPMAPADVAFVRDAVRAFFAENAPFAIDGAHQDPVVEAIEVPPDDVTGYGIPAMTFTLRYPVSARPRSVAVVWKVWERLAWYDAIKLPLVFRSFGEAQLVFVRPEEPSYTWRPESVVPRERPHVAPVEAPPQDRLMLPLVSAAAVLALLLGLPFLVRARVGALLIAALTASAGLTAWLARDAVVVAVPSPFVRAVVVPAPAEAVALFDRLQRNVYAAFDARTESDIYDLLAVSVAPELLDEMYGEVYESLIMRGQGGAVCQVEKLEVQEEEADVSGVYEPWDIVPAGREKDPFFKVRCKWRVHGVVSHWGHEHRRVNSYEANYTVRHAASGWKIAACEILDQSREDSDG